ncbi:unnamed protein product [Zymoseptoria tritici ST99CH_3D7]|uniref:Transcription factor domain-containing protein n=2 Tax=Zymoseptoria tritici TaxID=1047171 RepID=A0A1X7RNL7_ZYMT9|nr:unnamed protein product [Zymoseptoria tritici ST99CH_3D7]
MPDEADPAPVFVFLDPVNKPSTGKSAKFRISVRSHVTLRQHRVRRLQEKFASATSGSQGRGDQAIIRLDEKTPQDAAAKGTDLFKLEQTRPIVTTSADLTNASIAALRTGSLAFRLYILNEPSNDIGDILNDVEIDAISVINSYIQDSLSQARVWEAEHPVIVPGTAEKFLPHQIFEDPALVVSVMLLGLATILLDRPGPQTPMARRSMLRLRGHVMRSINSALDDSSRVVKDEVLVAVILLARSDAIYGSREAGLSESCPVHMTGVMDMVNMRGGLSELGFDGVVEAFVLWQDVNIAEMTGGKTYSHLVKDRNAACDTESTKRSRIASDGAGV